MLKKIYNLLINIKNKFYTTNHKDFYSNISSYILNLIRTVIDLIPKKTIFITVVLIWITLFIINNITIDCLIRFGTILIVIYIYRILHKEIYKIYLFLIKYINITESFLLKIYRYKNPIILILIEIELVLFHIIRYAQINNVQSKNINFIYHILYNISGLNGIKIILAKVYKILLDWKNYGIYELLLKKIYGIVLSVIIFTNIITLIIMDLNMITSNYIIWIYAFLVILSYIYIFLNYNIYTINDIELYRKQANLVWVINNINKDNNTNIEKNIFLEELLNVSLMISPEIINKNIKICLGFQGIQNILNFKNFLIYLILDTNNIINWWYWYFNTILPYHFDQNCIHIKNVTLRLIKLNNDILKQDVERENVTNFCEYHILLYKLRIFYIWDVEKTLDLDIQDSFLTIKKINYNEEFKELFKELVKHIDINKITNPLCYHFLTFNHTPDDAVYFKIDFNKDSFKKVYNEKIKNIQLNKFFDIYHKENYNFYQEMYNNLYDFNFITTTNYQSLINIKEEYNIHTTYDMLEAYIKQENEIINEFNNWKSEWELYKGKDIKLKYCEIFKKIKNIKSKILKI